MSALIRHLASDRSIGLIGPTTNAIGNEARVEVGYESISDMPRWAASFTREHDGETFDIAMLAMFCLAMRRDVFERLGEIDERFGIGMFEDDDYSFRARKAEFRVVCARDAFVHHWMKASFSRMKPRQYQALFNRNRALFEEKWELRWTPHKAR